MTKPFKTRLNIDLDFINIIIQKPRNVGNDFVPLEWQLLDPFSAMLGMLDGATLIHAIVCYQMWGVSIEIGRRGNGLV